PLGTGGGPAAPVAPSAGPSATGAAASAQSESPAGFGDSGLWFLGVGAVVLVVFLVGLARRRPSTSGPRGSLQGVTLHPAGGFAGAQSPPLNDGLMYWTVEPADRNAAVAVLVRMLSRHHNVILVGDEGQAATGEAGRSLYRMSSADPAALGDAVEALHRIPQRPGLVVFLGVGGSVEDWTARDQELPHGAGGIVLCTPEHAGPTPTHRVQVERPGRLRVVSVDGATAFVVLDRSAA
ncbi:MAG TPA: hypothetical protein DFR83_03435, partial [Deltaproteobacteria bacterium]|nr:hypothetical protein [Deltaproteobacteria bacterium]